MGKTKEKDDHDHDHDEDSTSNGGLMCTFSAMKQSGELANIVVVVTFIINILFVGYEL
jgi:hypothetical protein